MRVTTTDGNSSKLKYRSVEKELSEDHRFYYQISVVTNIFQAFFEKISNICKGLTKILEICNFIFKYQQLFVRRAFKSL